MGRLDGECERRIPVPLQLGAGDLDPDAEPLDEAEDPERLGEVGIPVMRKVLHRIRDAYGDHMAEPGWVDDREDLAKAFVRGRDGRVAVDYGAISRGIGVGNPCYPPEDVRDRLRTAWRPSSRYGP